MLEPLERLHRRIDGIKRLLPDFGTHACSNDEQARRTKEKRYQPHHQNQLRPKPEVGWKLHGDVLVSPRGNEFVTASVVGQEMTRVRGITLEFLS